ncbi:MAG: GNAT family N-acetyltransferase [Rhodoglobus sp.]|nr:GNAT family N-acetyltransferase [Rhodoglobus sp.]
MTDGAEFGRTRKLEPADPVREFRCGQPDLDEWIGRYALASQQAGMSTVFVSMSAASIAGYYALATGGVDPADAPARVSKGVPRHPVPVILLTRLAVDSRYQGLGLGRMLVRDALLRVDRAAGEIGVRALLVHAKDERARDYYLRMAEFEESPTDPLQLFLLMKDLRKSIIGV